MTAGFLPASGTHNNFTQILFIRKIETVRENLVPGAEIPNKVPNCISEGIFSNLAVDPDFFSG